MKNKWTEYRKQWAKLHPEQEREYARRYRRKHAVQLREAQRDYRKRCPELHRKWARDNYRKHALKEMLKKYNLTPEQWQTMFSQQQGRCQICHIKPRNGKYTRSLAVDHCHKTGKVRALLCYSCNNKVKALEDPRWLNRAQRYLAIHGTLGNESNSPPKVNPLVALRRRFAKPR